MNTIKKVHYTRYSNSGKTRTDYDRIIGLDSRGIEVSIMLNKKDTNILNSNAKRITYESEDQIPTHLELSEFMLRLAEREQWIVDETTRKEKEKLILQTLKAKEDTFIFGKMSYKEAFDKFGAEDEWTYETTTHHYSHFAAYVICDVLGIDFNDIVISFPLDKKTIAYNGSYVGSVSAICESECFIITKKGTFKVSTSLDPDDYVIYLKTACSITITKI